MPTAAAADDAESDLNIARAWKMHLSNTRFCSAYGRVTHLFPRCDMNKNTPMRRMELCVNCYNRAIRIIREADDAALRRVSEASRRSDGAA